MGSTTTTPGSTHPQHRATTVQGKGGSFRLPETSGFLHVTLTPQHAENSNLEQPEGTRGSVPSEDHLRNYESTVVLGIPGEKTTLDTFHFGQLADFGNSLLFVQEAEALELEVKAGPYHVRIVGRVNAMKRLTSLTLTYRAENLRQAEALTFNLIQTMLSWWSYQLDVAVDVMATEILEVPTGVRGVSANVLGIPKSVMLESEFTFPGEIRFLLSIYRQGVNTFNPFFQVLSFYKVIEGCKKLRDQRRTQVIQGGMPYLDPGERFPSTIDDVPLGTWATGNPFRQHLGQKFTKVRDEYRNLIRNAIAHLDPEGDSLMGDHWEHEFACRQAAPVLRYMARVLVEAELAVAGITVQGSDQP